MTKFLETNACVIGPTGAGKTTLALQIAQDALAAGHIVYVVGGGVDLHPDARVAVGPREAVTDLVDVVDHIAARRKAMQAFNCTTMADLPREARDLMPPVTVVIDDYADLLDSSSTYRDSIERIVTKIAREGTRFGVHITVISGRPVTGWDAAKWHRRVPVRGLLVDPDIPMPTGVVTAHMGTQVTPVVTDVIEDGAQRGDVIVSVNGDVQVLRTALA